MTSPAPHSVLLAILRDPGFDGDPGSDWPALLEAARTEALVPRLYAWLLASEDRRRRAGAWVERLRPEMVRLTARGLALTAELGQILRACQGAPLPCVALRGPALAERLYGEPTARPMGDLDLLVRRADLGSVRELLRGRGYHEFDRRRGFAEAYSYTLEFYRPAEPALVVEPHWTIAYPPAASRLDMDRVWSRCRRALVLGRETEILGAEDLVLHLCLHLVHASPAAPLLWRWELDRVIRQEGPRLDWSAFAQTLAEAGVGAEVGQALREIRELFGTRLPAEIAEPGPFLAEPRLAQRVAAVPIDGRESLALLFDMDGLGPKLRYALALLFPSRDFMRAQYGSAGRLPAARAYLRRFCHLAAEAARAVVALWRPRSRPAGSRR
jgi:putative nucleotidyltransferase-like protein